jgi:hypothetical protein
MVSKKNKLQLFSYSIVTESFLEIVLCAIG